MNLSEISGTLGNNPVKEGTEEHNSSANNDHLWTTEQVSRYLHVSFKTVFNLRKKGLPYVQLGGAVRFLPQEIKDYLVSNRDLTAHRLRQSVRKQGSK